MNWNYDEEEEVFDHPSEGPESLKAVFIAFILLVILLWYLFC